MNIPDANLIEQIVAAVERQLADDMSGGVGEAGTSVQPVVAGGGDEVECVECVEQIVTGEILSERITSETRQLRIRKSSILTPTARELIARHELLVTVDSEVGQPRCDSDVQSESGWLLLLVGEDVAELRGVVSERSEGIESALSRVCERLSSAEGSGVVVLSREPHRLACLANRRSQVRAVVVQDAEEAAGLLVRLGANLVVACPLATGAWQSRQIVETCLAAESPRVPEDWPS